MSGTHISHIPYRMYRRFDGSPQITGKPHIHGDIVSSVIPSIIRYQLQSSRNFTVHLTSLGWQSDGRDTFQQTFAKRFHFPLLTNLFDDVMRSRIGIVGLLGTIHQRTSGDADTVAVRLNQFMSNRITDRHRKFQCHLIACFPMTLDRQIAIGRPCAHLAAIHRSTYLGRSTVGITVKFTRHKAVVAPSRNTKPKGKFSIGHFGSHLDVNDTIKRIVRFLGQLDTSAFQRNLSGTARIETTENVIVRMRINHSRHLRYQTSHVRRTTSGREPRRPSGTAMIECLLSIGFQHIDIEETVAFQIHSGQYIII